MANVGAEFFVELSGMLVQPDLLGRSLTVRGDAHSYRVDLPEAEDSFKFPMVSSLGETDQREYVPTQCIVGDISREFVEVRIVRVVVNMEGELSADGYDDTDIGQRTTAHEQLDTLLKHAMTAATDLTNMVRLRGQSAIPPTGRYPRVLNMVTMVEILDTHTQSYGFSVGSASTGIRIIGPHEVLSVTDLSAVESSLGSVGAPWVGELLVGEALYLVQSEQNSGAEQGTLLAAMGVEVHTRDVVDHLAKGEQKELVALLLDNPRQWTMAAFAVFERVLPVVVGRDLGPEHKALARRVEKLFRARNKVAHRAKPISRDEALKHSATANEAVQFLRALL